jgi:hypothetical protein
MVARTVVAQPAAESSQLGVWIGLGAVIVAGIVGALFYAMG